MTIYTMTTISSSTRIRSDHNTFASVLTSVPYANTKVTGSELWVAPADGSEVKAGDKWVKVTYDGVTGWMAYIHKGVAICKDFLAAGEVIPNPPPPVSTPIFPNSFVLTAPDGSKAEYKFVKVL